MADYPIAMSNDKGFILPCLARRIDNERGEHYNRVFSANNRGKGGQ